MRMVLRVNNRGGSELNLGSWKSANAANTDALFELVRLGGEPAVEIHGQVLIEDHGDVAGTSFHFTGGPARKLGKLGISKPLHVRDSAVVDGDFLEPGAALLQVRGQLVAQVHEAAKIGGANS